MEDLPDTMGPDDIQRLLDAADEVDFEPFTLSSSSRIVGGLQRKMKKNRDLRIEHEGAPEKYLKSEVDLDEEISRCSQAAAEGPLLQAFADDGGLDTLAAILENHPNNDIVETALAVLAEMTEVDTIFDTRDPDAFADKVISLRIPSLCVAALGAIDEFASDEDFDGVTNALRVFENLVECRPSVCEDLGRDERFTSWLIRRVCRDASTDYNRIYASEALSILLQNAAAAHTALLADGASGVLALTAALAPLVGRRPADAEAEEFAENLAGCLCTLMASAEARAAFANGNGIEIIINMLNAKDAATKERLPAYRTALRVTNYATASDPLNCSSFVEKGGLPPLFGIFMKKVVLTKRNSKEEAEDEEHLATIIHSLLRNCTGGPYGRVLHKFIENGCEKLEALLELHEKYRLKILAARDDAAIVIRDETLPLDVEEQRISDRMEAGLSVLQQVDLTIMRLGNTGNEEVSQRLRYLLNIKGISLQQIHDVILEFVRLTDETEGAERREETLELLRNFESQLGRKRKNDERES